MKKGRFISLTVGIALFLFSSISKGNLQKERKNQQLFKKFLKMSPVLRDAYIRISRKPEGITYVKFTRCPAKSSWKSAIFPMKKIMVWQMNCKYVLNGQQVEDVAYINLFSRSVVPKGRDAEAFRHHIGQYWFLAKFPLHRVPPHRQEFRDFKFILTDGLWKRAKIWVHTYSPLKETIEAFAKKEKAYQDAALQLYKLYKMRAEASTTPYASAELIARVHTLIKAEKKFFLAVGNKKVLRKAEAKNKEARKSVEKVSDEIFAELNPLYKKKLQEAKKWKPTETQVFVGIGFFLLVFVSIEHKRRLNAKRKAKARKAALKKEIEFLSKNQEAIKIITESFDDYNEEKLEGKLKELRKRVSTSLSVTTQSKRIEEKSEERQKLKEESRKKEEEARKQKRETSKEKVLPSYKKALASISLLTDPSTKAQKNRELEAIMEEYRSTKRANKAVKALERFQERLTDV